MIPSAPHQMVIPIYPTLEDKSRCMIGFGIALIITSLLTLIPGILLKIVNDIGDILFVIGLIATILFLMMGMHAVYVGCSMFERRQTSASVIIMGITAIVIAAPTAVIYIAFGIDGFMIQGNRIDLQNDDRNAFIRVMLAGAFFFVDIVLAIVISSISCKNCCLCCSGSNRTVRPVTGNNPTSFIYRPEGIVDMRQFAIFQPA